MEVDLETIGRSLSDEAPDAFERACIGSLLQLDPASASALAAAASPDLFHTPSNQHAWSILRAAALRGTPLGPEVASAAIEAAPGLLAAYPGTPGAVGNHLEDCLRIAGDYPDSWPEYTQKLKLQHARHVLSATMDAATVDSFTASNASDAMDLALSRVIEAASKLRSITSDTNYTATDAAAEFLDDYERPDVCYPFPQSSLNSLGGLRPTEVCVMTALTGGGKAQPVSEPVLTPDGWRPIGEIRPGDKVVGPDGKPRSVVAIHPQGIKDVFTVSTNDQRETRCCADHLWTVQTDADIYADRSRTITTAEMRESLLDSTGKRRYVLPQAAAVRGRGKPMMDAYTLGVLLGDGYLGGTAMSFTSADSEIADRVAEAGYGLRPRNGKATDSAARTYWIPAGDGVIGYLKWAGLHGLRAHEKYIPEEWFTLPAKHRLELLRGLMDTDGWVQGNGSHYCTTSRQLCDGVVELVRGLGGKATVSTKVPKYRSAGKGREWKEGRLAYNVCVYLPGGKSPFRLKRKSSLLTKRVKYKWPRSRIAAVEPAGKEECVCITVDDPDGLYITKDYMVTHNSRWLLQWALDLILSGKRVWIYTLEMGRRQMLRRMLCMHMGWDMQSLVRREISREQIAEAFAQLPLSRLRIIDRDISSGRIHSDLATAGDERPHVVAVDHLHLMPVRSGEDYLNGFNSMVNGFKPMAMDNDVAIVLLAQMRRAQGVSDGARVRPHMGMLKGSSAIEQIADYIIMLWKTIEDNPYGSDREQYLMWAEKQRDGEPVADFEVTSRGLRFVEATA